MPWFLEMTGGGYSAKAPGDGTVDFSGARKDDFVYSARARNFLDLPRNASLEFGGSLLAGHTTVGAAQRVLGLDLTLKNAPPRNVKGHNWTLQGEWIRKSTGDTQEQEGWYSALQYRLGFGWWVGARTERVIRVQGAAFAPTLTVDSLGQDLYESVDASERRHTLELTWAKGEFTAIRVDASYGTVDSSAGTAVDRRFLLQFNHTIGTHPAHNF